MELPTVYKIECTIEEADDIVQKAASFGAKEFNRDVIDERFVRIFFQRLACVQRDD